jgi:hypothetical protein
MRKYMQHHHYWFSTQGTGQRTLLQQLEAEDCDADEDAQEGDALDCPQQTGGARGEP